MSSRISVCHFLREDPDLADAVPASLRQRATDECIAPTMRLPVGRWDGQQARSASDGFGLLVLEGLLLRRVGVDGRFGAELLGAGDLLRPWQGQDAHPVLPRMTGWRVLEPCRAAVLDRRVLQRMSRYPDLTIRLVERALERSRNLAVNVAIIHQARVDVRLHMLLWHLAERWGRVTPRGVAIPLKLSHNVLSELVAARRPTVTTALSDLSRRQILTHTEQGWLLAGEPPVELLELKPGVPH